MSTPTEGTAPAPPPRPPVSGGPGTPIDVPGVRNLRDAGGVGELRPGILYRSGALDALTARGAERLGELGLRTVIDLRSTPEVAAAPDVRDGLGFTYRRAPVFVERRWPAEQRELYPAMAGRAGRSTVAVIRAITAPGAVPVLVHCASGKDRTGLTVAVLQTLLGASEAEVTEDFLRSNEALGLGTWAHSAVGGPVAGEQPLAVNGLVAGERPGGGSPRPGHGALPVAATHLFHALLWIRSHHGSVPDWLLAHGATESELADLRAVLSGRPRTP
ncbi:tyrosine-protein phosphatase [Streptomyces sp. NPDC057682]|uniref:tyrosine-protein phosphatase n=1 Tax=Streptomyces sp. NPDC057682 TaxID=3346210 RepID=UPI0036795623